MDLVDFETTDVNPEQLTTNCPFGGRACPQGCMVCDDGPQCCAPGDSCYLSAQNKTNWCLGFVGSRAPRAPSTPTIRSFWER